MAKEQESANQPESSIRRGNNMLWKGIWNMNSPNVLKNFMWRACKNLLLTKENLMKRKVVEEPLCPICNLEVETTLHVLWDCPASIDVWGASHRFFQQKLYLRSRFFPGCGNYSGEGGWRYFSTIF
jgi:hypothetical protein